MSLAGDLIVLSQAQVPVMIGTHSPLSIGGQIAAMDLASPTSDAGWGTANDAIFIPFNLPRAATVVKLWCLNGATVGGNVDMGIYDESGTRQVSIGSTAQAGTNTIQAFDIADTTLNAGRWYLAIAGDSDTQTLFCWATSVVTLSATLGMAKQATAFALPASATLAAHGISRIPLIGLSLRTLVA